MAVWYGVYEKATGRLHSLTSEGGLADPMPAEYGVVELPAAFDGSMEGWEWLPQQRRLVPDPTDFSEKLAAAILAKVARLDEAGRGDLQQRIARAVRTGSAT